MSQAAALKLALEIFHMPSRVRSARSEPLHDGVLQVLLIAAGDADAEREAAEQLERPLPVIKDAAAFYIEQILLGPDSDSYRVLGADRDAPTTELRRNMALLLRFLHPDHDPTGKRSMFAGRVIAAWDSLKSPDRRSAYDTGLASRGARAGGASSSNGAKRNARKPGGGRPNGAHASERPSRGHALTILPPEPPGLIARALRFLLGHKS